MTDTHILDDYLSRDAVAEQLGISTRTLERWARMRVGPPVTRLGKAPFYYVPSFREWLRSREQTMVREHHHAA